MRRTSSRRTPRKAEESETFPRDAFRTLGKAGLLGLPYPEQYGGAEQPYEVYLQMLEEIAAAWMSVGVGVSVHTMTSYAARHLRHRRSSGPGCCPTWSAASSSAPTRCPSRRPVPISAR